jgi:[NiFe] hydrogenase diaphorase moiety small subunit
VGAILSRHQGFEKPIGERLYDRQPISVVGDVAENEQDEDR